MLHVFFLKCPRLEPQLVLSAALLRHVDVKVNDLDEMMGLEMMVATAPYVTNTRHPILRRNYMVQLLEVSGHDGARRFYANIVVCDCVLVSVLEVGISHTSVERMA